MSTFYINSVVQNGAICLTYGHDGQVLYAKIEDYKPCLFTMTPNETPYTELITRKNVQKIKFDSIKHANKAIKEARELPDMKYYGNRNYNLTFLHENFKDMETSYDPKMIRGFDIDIECPAEHGFPCPIKAEWPINVMCIRDSITGIYHVWGDKAFDIDVETERFKKEGIVPNTVKYYHIPDEGELLQSVLDFWTSNYPAYISGWNTAGFDLPYLYNRMRRFGLKVKTLSPWNNVWVKEFEVFGKPAQNISIAGIADLDYLDLYKKNRFITRESYKLGFIAEIELCKDKVDFSEVASDLRTLHKKDWQTYVVYNIVDTALINQFDEKLGFIGITFAVAYASGINYDDVSSPVGTWEQIMYRETIKDNVILPPKQDHDKASYEGGYVKFPQVGKHKWVVSFDLNSLYPHLIEMFNISPETITSTFVPEVNVDMMVDELPFTRPAGDLAVAPSGNTFRKDILGIAPKKMNSLYAERKSIKKEMLVHEQDKIDAKVAISEGNVMQSLMDKYSVDSMEAARDAAEKQETLKDGGQMVRKILLNSFYGALANIHFNLFDIRLAESITKGGQLAIRHVGRVVNEYLNAMLKTNTDYVVYTDTDSIYVKLDIIVERMGMSGETPQAITKMLDQFCEAKMLPCIRDGYEGLKTYTNAYAQKMIMAREVIAERGVFCKKKRYFMSVWNSEGTQYDKPKTKVMGLDLVKSSTPQFVRDAMSTTVDMILGPNESDVQDFIATFKQEFRAQPPEAIAFPRGVNKMEESYCNGHGEFMAGVTVPINSRAAINFNQYSKKLGIDQNYQEIVGGDKIKFVYLTKPNRLQSHVVGWVDFLPPEFKLHDRVDYDTMFEKTYLKPIRDILNVVDWEVEPSATCDDWF